MKEGESMDVSRKGSQVLYTCSAEQFEMLDYGVSGLHNCTQIFIDMRP